MKIVIEDFTPVSETQDRGASMIAEFVNDGDIFVRLLSYDETRKHEQLTKLLEGGRIRITIENMKETK